ncbi:PREDICTED: annexin A11-like [Branchiostoma belcheri]|uniref:Annexin A11-like n=1 Tax=Branchiostoma belcheri TaxID=7741 RepID=A0A6P4Z4N3_BRABE|nr:PREDICTED: annexin A11-like [Branchiostoma belcheri]
MLQQAGFYSLTGFRVAQPSVTSAGISAARQNAACVSGAAGKNVINGLPGLPDRDAYMEVIQIPPCPPVPPLGSHTPPQGSPHHPGGSLPAWPHPSVALCLDYRGLPVPTQGTSLPGDPYGTQSALPACPHPGDALSPPWGRPCPGIGTEHGYLGPAFVQPE